MADMLSKVSIQPKPSLSRTLLANVPANTTEINVTATADAWIYIEVANDSTIRTVSGYIREFSGYAGYGTGFYVVYSSYVSGPLAMVPCQKGMTYNIHADGNTSGLLIYQC